MEDFVPFDLAKKLKEKGFTCKYPFAMYNELGSYCPLTTSSDYVTCESGYKYRCYYDYNDFDENDFIAPTISQVLKWLREEKKIHFEFVAAAYGYNVIISQTPEAGGTDYYFTHMNDDGPNDGGAWDRYEDAALYCIEYVLDNLI